jgi:hypothetical protein
VLLYRCAYVYVMVYPMVLSTYYFTHHFRREHLLKRLPFWCVFYVRLHWLYWADFMDSCVWPCLTWHCQPIKSAEYNQWSPLLRLL